MNNENEARFASKDLTAGELNALVKFVGGEEMTRDILAKRRTVTVSDLIVPKWTERDGVIYFTLVSNGLTGPEWITHLESKGFKLTKWAKDLLNSKDFVPTPKGTVHEMGAIRATQFQDSDRTTKAIRAKAEGLKMSKPNPETACLIRELFTDKELEEMGLWYIVPMHEPILDSDCGPCLLDANRYGDGRYLGTHCGRPVVQWIDSGAFAFGCRK